MSRCQLPGFEIRAEDLWCRGCGRLATAVSAVYTRMPDSAPHGLPESVESGEFCPPPIPPTPVPRPSPIPPPPIPNPEDPGVPLTGRSPPPSPHNGPADEPPPREPESKALTEARGTEHAPDDSPAFELSISDLGVGLQSFESGVCGVGCEVWGPEVGVKS